MPFRRHIFFHRKKRNGPAGQPTGANDVSEHSTSQPIDIPLSVERSTPRLPDVLASQHPPRVTHWPAALTSSRVAEHGVNGIKRAGDRNAVLSIRRRTDEVAENRATKPSSSRQPEIAADSEAILTSSSRHNVLKSSQDKITIDSDALPILRRSAAAQGGRRRDGTQISPALHTYNSSNKYSDSGVSTVDSTKIVIGGQGYRSDNGTFAGALLQQAGTSTWLSPSTQAPSQKSAGDCLSPARRGKVLTTNPGNAPTKRNRTTRYDSPTIASSSRSSLAPFQTTPPDPEEHGTVVQYGGFIDLSPPDDDAFDPYQYDEILRQRKIQAHEDYLVAIEEVRQDIGKMKERQEKKAAEEKERMLERIRRGKIG